MKHTNQESNPTKPLAGNATSKSVGGTEDHTVQSSTEPSITAGSRPPSKDMEGDGREQPIPYSIGYKKPPVRSQFQKGHKGYRRRNAPMQTNYVQELGAELNKKVTVTGKAGQRQMRGLVASAKNTAQILMKGHPKDWAQFMKLKQHRDELRASPQVARSRLSESSEGDKKPRKSFEGIMHTFAEEIFEHAHRALCEEFGKLEFPVVVVWSKALELIQTKHAVYVDPDSTDRLIIMMRFSIAKYALILDPNIRSLFSGALGSA